MTLILGAGGFLGLNAVDAFMARGVRPTCGRRKRSNVLGLRERGASLVEADLDQPASLAGAFEGHDTVIHLAGHYPRLSNDRAGTLALALRQTQAVLDAAANSGVRRVVYASSTATVAARADGAPSTEADVFAAAPGFGVYHDVKWHLEALVESEARFETVTVCPSACLGPHDWKVGTSAMWWQLLRGQVPPHPNGALSWVDVRDVAQVLVGLTEIREPPRRLLVSAATLDVHDLLHGLARRYGVSPVPPALTNEAALALADAEEARAAVERTHRPRLSRELVDLLIHGPHVDAARAPALLGFRYRPLEDTLTAFEAWARRMGGPVPSPHPTHTIGVHS